MSASSTVSPVKPPLMPSKSRMSPDDDHTTTIDDNQPRQT